jgi:hypothetical protein
VPGPELADRLEALEEGLRALQAEFEQVRRLAAEASAPAAEPVVSSAMTRAWRELERGHCSQAIQFASEALEKALRDGDDEARRELVSFAGVAANSVGADLLPQALDIANRAAKHPVEPEPGAGPPPAPVSARLPVGPSPPAPLSARLPVGAPSPARVSAPRPVGVATPARPRTSVRRPPRIQLTDARVFALAGGVVTLLGVVFLFVLAANRGWIGPVARVSIGAATSSAAVAAGIALRMRFGRLQASLAAVGTGVAGAYATLAAATVVYDFLPTWGALLVAAAIAATGATLALRWSSQLLAGLSLVGAAAAPALVALDQGIAAAGTAFAVVVLAASLVAGAAKRWLWLAATVGVVAVGQVAWLAAVAGANDAAALAVVAGTSLVLLGGSVLWQPPDGALDQVATSLAFAGAGVAFGGLALGVTAGVYGLVALAALRRFAPLAHVIGAAALVLAAIATAFLFSGRSLTLVWAIEAAVLAALAWRIASPRFELAALGYLALGIAHAFLIDVRLDAPAGDLPRSSAVGLFTLAAAAAAVGAFARGEWPVARGGRFDPLWRGLAAQRDLVRFWVWGAAVALLAVATAAALSGVWLTVALAVEAAAFAVAGRQVASTYLGAVALAYLTIGVFHAFGVDVAAGRPPGDLPTSSAAGLYPLAAAALVAGVCAIGLPQLSTPARALERGVGVVRGTLRLYLWVAAVSLAGFATAAVLSGRELTLAWAAAAAAVAIAAAATGERRLQAAGLALLGAAAVHALVVEAQPTTLMLGRDVDTLAALPSLLALAGSSAVVAVTSSFTGRGLAFLGPLEDAEAILTLLGRRAREVRDGLAVAATGFALWAATLVVVWIAYTPGQCIATALWAAAGIAAAVVAARRRSIPLALLAIPSTGLAFAKAIGFDYVHLGDRAAAVSILFGSVALLLVGFCERFAAPRAGSFVTAAAWVTAVVAADSALGAVQLLSGDRTRAFGAGALLVATAIAALAVPPYRMWRRADPRAWARNVATGYWGIGLAILVVAETALIDSSLTKTVAAGAVTAALVATASRPLVETRLWLVACLGTAVPVLVCLALRTPPSRLVVASSHPGAGLWAFLVCAAALAWVAVRTPDVYRRAAVPLLGSSLVLALFGLSLGVLEVAERLSGASMQTDFQRGHTVVSAFWGVLALVGFVIGLTRRNRPVQRAGLALFGLSLAKLFLYDLASLSSITRALSFLAVGAVLLTAAFFVERLIHGDGAGPRPAH